MPMLTVHDIYTNALSLNPREQAELVDKLIAQLDEPDNVLDELWKTEAERRIDAFDQGKISSVSLTEVLEKYFHA